ncbi:hypothetical protein [Streptomyces chartreusis]|uniref:Uncharacterized protein n=1 Tax=Streptomyces chartreusis TaxID=1969 RepID=A0A7H8T4J1_STRCX|nr:hypothetical protein [Streptomyces chartreusis]QKZ18391.1 hypothetical protein HUT05_14075 [Streptomyces chartreusis]
MEAVAARAVRTVAETVSGVRAAPPAAADAFGVSLDIHAPADPFLKPGLVDRLRSRLPRPTPHTGGPSAV